MQFSLNMVEQLGYENEKLDYVCTTSVNILKHFRRFGVKNWTSNNEF